MQPVIEIEYQLRVAHKALRCGHILHPIIVPQSIRITERAHTTFGTDTSTGQHHYFPFIKTVIYPTSSFKQTMRMHVCLLGETIHQ